MTNVVESGSEHDNSNKEPSQLSVEEITRQTKEVTDNLQTENDKMFALIEEGKIKVDPEQLMNLRKMARDYLNSLTALQKSGLERTEE